MGPKNNLEEVVSQYSEAQIEQLHQEAIALQNQYLSYADKMEGVKAMLAKSDEAKNKLPQSIAKSISCKKGCAFCCHIRAISTLAEAELVVQYATEHKIEIDTDRLFKQQDLDEIQYMFSSYSRCVFLDDDNTCKVYEVRPMVCRNHFVTSAPSLCDTKKYPQGRVEGYLNMDAALPAAALMLNDEPDSFPKQLLKAINNLQI